MVLLDRERLLADLHAAIDAATPSTRTQAYDWGWRLQEMRRAWAILLNALEDGEYDLHQGEGA